MSSLRLAPKQPGARYRLRRHHSAVGHPIDCIAAAAQGAHGVAVTAGSAAQAKVDAAGVECFERAIGFGNAQGRMVEQHDATRADTQVLRMGGGAADQDFGDGRGDGGHAVVLGIPEARIAQRIGGLGEPDGFGHRLWR